MGSFHETCPLTRTAILSGDPVLGVWVNPARPNLWSTHALHMTFLTGQPRDFLEGQTPEEMIGKLEAGLAQSSGYTETEARQLVDRMRRAMPVLMAPTHVIAAGTYDEYGWVSPPPAPPEVWTLTSDNARVEEGRTPTPGGLDGAAFLVHRWAAETFTGKLFPGDAAGQAAWLRAFLDLCEQARVELFGGRALIGGTLYGSQHRARVKLQRLMGVAVKREAPRVQDPE